MHLWPEMRQNSDMARFFRNSSPSALCAIERASRRPTLCFAVRDEEKGKPRGMIIPQFTPPAQVPKTQPISRPAAEVIAEMAEKQNAIMRQNQLADSGEEREKMSVEEMYQRGQAHYVKKEFPEAAKWFYRAAEQGHAGAQCNLGNMCYFGEGMPRDFDKSVEWYRPAAEQGHAEAQYNLGMAWENGRGVPHDYAEATKWLRLAAEQGFMQFDFAMKYYVGHGVNQDKSEAVKWLLRAAEQEDAGAQAFLSAMYIRGRRCSAKSC